MPVYRFRMKSMISIETSSHKKRSKIAPVPNFTVIMSCIDQFYILTVVTRIFDITIRFVHTPHDSINVSTFRFPFNVFVSRITVKYL